MTGMAPSLKVRKAVGLQVLGMEAYRRAYAIWNFTSYQLPIIIRGAFLSRRRSIARQKARKKLSSKVLDDQPCASHRYLGETSRKLARVFLSRFFSFLYICALHLDEKLAAYIRFPIFREIISQIFTNGNHTLDRIINPR